MRVRRIGPAPMRECAPPLWQLWHYRRAVGIAEDGVQRAVWDGVAKRVDGPKPDRPKRLGAARGVVGHACLQRVWRRRSHMDAQRASLHVRPFERRMQLVGTRSLGAKRHLQRPRLESPNSGPRLCLHAKLRPWPGPSLAAGSLCALLSREAWPTAPKAARSLRPRRRLPMRRSARRLAVA